MRGVPPLSLQRPNLIGLLLAERFDIFDWNGFASSVQSIVDHRRGALDLRRNLANREALAP